MEGWAAAAGGQFRFTGRVVSREAEIWLSGH
jgi:hypothetical protein